MPYGYEPERYAQMKIDSLRTHGSNIQQGAKQLASDISGAVKSGMEMAEKKETNGRLYQQGVEIRKAYIGMMKDLQEKYPDQFQGAAQQFKLNVRNLEGSVPLPPKSGDEASLKTYVENMNDIYNDAFAKLKTLTDRTRAGEMVSRATEEQQMFGPETGRPGETGTGELTTIQEGITPDTPGGQRQVLARIAATNPEADLEQIRGTVGFNALRKDEPQMTPYQKEALRLREYEAKIRAASAGKSNAKDYENNAFKLLGNARSWSTNIARADKAVENAQSIVDDNQTILDETKSEIQSIKSKLDQFSSGAASPMPGMGGEPSEDEKLRARLKEIQKERMSASEKINKAYKDIAAFQEEANEYRMRKDEALAALDEYVDSGGSSGVIGSFQKVAGGRPEPSGPSRPAEGGGATPAPAASAPGAPAARPTPAPAPAPAPAAPASDSTATQHAGDPTDPVSVFGLTPRELEIYNRIVGNPSHRGNMTAAEVAAHAKEYVRRKG
jgi:hypothetical protein